MANHDCRRFRAPGEHSRLLQPKAVSGVFAGGHAAFVPGLPPSVTIQSWFTGADVPRFPITAGSLRGDSVFANPSGSVDLELTYVSSPVTFAQFSPTLAQNLVGTAVTVLPRTVINLPGSTPGDGPNGGHNWWIPFTAPFVFTGPNLVAQTRIFSFSSSNNQPVFVDSYVQQAPTQHYSVGRSCGGNSSLVASHDGVNFGLRAEGVPPTQTVAFLLGQENLALGNTRLPLDLSRLGMTGCELGLAPQLVLFATANAFGAATLTFPAAIPDESVAIHAQAFHRTNINPAGFALTNVATSVLGNKGMCNFVFSIDGVNAVSGPSPFNNSAVLIFR